MIKYIKGNLLNAEQNLIIHQCNAMGVMGSGVAKAIRDKHPQAYIDYINYFELIPKRKRVGMVQYTIVNDSRTVANLIGEYHYLPRGELHTDYDALRAGFNAIKEYTREDIAMPKIGCGLGGGDWNVVSALIEEVFDDRDVYIYEL